MKLFQKVFVANGLAVVVDRTFALDAPYNGLRVLFAVYAFAIQILCDFGGYSCIARGVGKVMGRASAASDRRSRANMCAALVFCSFLARLVNLVRRLIWFARKTWPRLAAARTLHWSNCDSWSGPPAIVPSCLQGPLALWAPSE